MSKRARLRAFVAISLFLLLAAKGLRGQDIIVNGSFNTNLAGWGLDPGVGKVQWSSDGTLLLTNDAAPPNQTASASQCDPISGGFFYTASARMEPINFVGSPNSSSGLKRVEHTGSLYVLLDFFPLDNCRGSALPQFVRLSAAGATDGKFITVSEPFLAPGAAVSMLVSLAILKDQAADNLQAEFDDISVATSSTPPPPPVANFNYLPSSPVVAQTVNFTDESSGADFWAWDFGDPSSGGFNTSSVKNPVHVYDAQGTYTVTLKVTNATASDSKSLNITVSPPPPVADFTFSPAAPGPAETVQFTDVSNGAPTSWSWTFGDPSSGTANTSTQRDPTHLFAAVGVYTVTLSAKNAGGTGLRNHSVTVAVAPPAASFTFTPPSPSVGETVQFNDTSTGSPNAWSWNFGDPGSGAANTSPLQNPTHLFGAAGTYSVSLKATGAGGSATQTKTLTISAFSTRSVSLPVAGHVTGVGGTVFLTDVLIENPNPTPAAATLFFYPVSGAVPSQTALSLAPLETKSLPDVVANQFGVTNSFGALRLDTIGAPPAPLRMTSRTYDVVGGGSFGMAVSGVPLDGPAASLVAKREQRAETVPSRFVTGLQRNDQFRSNVGGVNDSDQPESYAIVLRGTDGSILGTSPSVTLPPSGQWQVGIKDLFPSVSGDALTAEFQWVAGSAVPVGYGTLADNQSGDLTYFPSLHPASVVLLPVISRITGVGGALFASDLTIANVTDSAAAVSLTFWEHDRDNTAGAKQASLNLAARETRLIPDALSTLFGLSETFGALKIESSGSVAVAERIGTQSPTTPGTDGQQVDPVVLPDALYTKASILGMRQDSQFRSNAGFINPNDAAATISLTLRRPSGAVIGQTSVAIPARGFTQFSLAGLFPGVVFPSGELLTIALDSGSNPVSAYGIIADNVSQDLTASPALP